MKGSFTVEASVIVPMFFFIIVCAISIAVNIYGEIKKEYEPQAISQMWEVPNFYRYKEVQWAIEEFGEMND